MNFEEYAGKPLLRAAGLETPTGEVVDDVVDGQPVDWASAVVP